MDIIAEIQKMEKKIESLTKNRQEWMNKHRALEQKLETAEMNRISPDVVEQLEIQKGKLLVELNEYKRAFSNLNRTHNETLKRYRKMELQLTKIREALK